MSEQPGVNEITKPSVKPDLSSFASCFLWYLSSHRSSSQNINKPVKLKLSHQNSTSKVWCDFSDTKYVSFYETNCQNRICGVNKAYDKSYPCIPGYGEDTQGDCIDIVECSSGTDACGVHTGCKNTVGGYRCKCNNGYQKDNQTAFCPSNDKKKNVCTDIDECSDDPGICGSNQICHNTPGSYNCTCAEGYKNISNTCVDECKTGGIKCGSNQICRNTGGSYNCTCAEGYKNISNRCMENPCNFNSSLLKEKENCDKSQDTACLFLRATLLFLNSSCTNITTEKPQHQLKNAINRLSNILNAQNDSFTADSTKNNERRTEILKNVERLTLKSFIDEPRNQTITTAELDVSMQLVPDGCRFFALILNDNLMKVPCPMSNQANDGAIFIVYKDLKSSLNGKLSPFEEEDEVLVINSRVVTGAITGKLTENVTFQLAHIQVPKSSQELTCVFWDPKKNNWSEDGCIKKSSESNSTHTTCSCNHLSSFALLLMPAKHESDPGHDIVSEIGLSLSIFCLMLSLLTFILCRSLRSAHTSVLTALCSCLLLGQVLFLVGFRGTRYKILCSIITGGLHFLFLCAFCWMSIESVLLFMTVRNLRAVNYMTSRRSNFPVMCLLGFGIPAIIVGISAAVQPHGYGTKFYCWLEPDSLIWSFLGPVAVLIISNTTLLVCTIVLLRKRLATLNTNVSTLKNSRSLTFKALAQLFILGCTWGIGYFQFGEGAVVISYIFTICNSLQGVYIFLVHCILNNQVRQEYRKLFGRTQKRSSDDTTPITTNKSMNLSEITKPMSSEKSSDRTVNWT
ncbi:adhesion G protein-coupled receptor E3-like [Eleutherodactylus coqui]|uniref:adhesion G protein-coupled receptor E3-like n=1 Tax=Eleutherodactylus coqui TaxID=57060 RepID=UPI003463408C